MKKYIFFFCFLIAFSVNIFAQRSSFGPIIGLNNATVSNVLGGKNKVGLRIGAKYNYMINDYFSMSAGLAWSAKGFKYSVGAEENIIQKLNYAEIPLMVKFFIPTNGTMRPTIFGGAVTSILMSAIKDSLSVNITNTEDFSKLDFSLLAGVGMTKKLGEAKLINFDLRYTHGLNKVGNQPFANSFQRVVSFNVSLLFPAGSKKSDCPTFWEFSKDKPFDPMNAMKKPQSKESKFDKKTGRVKKRR